MNTAVLSFRSIFRQKHARLQAIAGLDFQVLVTLFFRGWALVAGGATVFLLPLWLSPTEQGYYFTFASANEVVDCYTQQHVDKFTLLNNMRNSFLF